MSGQPDEQIKKDNSQNDELSCCALCFSGHCHARKSERLSLYIRKQPKQTAFSYKAAAVTIRKKAYNKKPIIFQMILVLIVLLSANSRHQATSCSQ